MKPLIEWVVQNGDGSRLFEIVAKMQKWSAVPNARIYLNGRLCELDELVSCGDRVEIFPSRAISEDAVEIVMQRDGIVLAHKPAKWPTETTKLGEQSVVSALMAQLRTARVHAASRLDVGVSGLVLCTLGNDAQKRVEYWRQTEQIKRSYMAIAHGELPNNGTWEWPLGRVRDHAGRHRSSPRARHTKTAITSFEVLARTGPACIMRLSPKTGRMHQLRAHASLAEAPLYGDRLYGGPGQVTEKEGHVLLVARVALVAHFFEVESIVAHVPIPKAMYAIWRALGGDDQDWSVH